MDPQRLEKFKLRLAQTIFWCAPRADISKPETSLRTPELRPPLLEESRDRTVDAVVNTRELYGGLEIRESTIPARLGGGRLLAYFPDADLACGAAEQESLGFFDIHNVPPWDTWVDYLHDDSSSDISYGEYLIAWVPPEFVKLADEGVAVNPEECIMWLSDTTVELVRVLQGENQLT